MHVRLTQLAAWITDPLTLAGVILLAGFLLSRLAFRSNRIAAFLCQIAAFAGFTMMLAAAKVSPWAPTPAMEVDATYVLISFFKIVWWVATSWLMAGMGRALLVFDRKPVETRFLQDLCAGVIYVGAGLGIIAYVFDIPVSGLLAASGVIAIVLGLALQSTLGDVFSGIVLNLAKPYHPGDWVILDGGLQGRVIETNWRATQILTLGHDLAIVPNSIIAKGRLVNASQPTGVHGVTIIVRLDPGVVPSSAVAVLETALLSCNRILRLPAAIIAIRSLDAGALECEVTFFVSTIEKGPEAQNEVFDLVFRHCVSAGIRIAPSASSGAMLPARGPPPEPGDVARRLLEHLPIFAPLSSDERLSLAPRMVRKSFKAGDVVIERGVVAPALFILSAGVLAGLQAREGSDVDVLRFAPGDCFCQASVLTGAVTTFKVVALTRASVYQIARDDLAPVLKSRPAIAEKLAQIMAKWPSAGPAGLGTLDVSDRHPDHLAARLAERMKLLFGLG